MNFGVVGGGVQPRPGPFAHEFMNISDYQDITRKFLKMLKFSSTFCNIVFFKTYHWFVLIFATYHWFFKIFAMHYACSYCLRSIHNGADCEVKNKIYKIGINIAMNKLNILYMYVYMCVPWGWNIVFYLISFLMMMMIESLFMIKMHDTPDD